MRTKGDLCGFGIRTETEYGKIGTGTTLYGGSLRTLDIPHTVGVDNDMGACGNRADGEPYVTSHAYAYNAEFTFPDESTSGWTAWLEYAVGSLNGMTRELPSHTAVFHIASDEEEIAVGSTVNSLRIAASALGEALTFTVGCNCRCAAIGTSGSFEVPGNGTVSFPIPERLKAPPLRFRDYPSYKKTSASASSAVKCKAWTLSVSTELTEDAGLEGDIPLSAGLGIVPGATTIALEMTVTSSGPEWDLLQEEYPLDMTFEVPIGSKRVVLKGCRFDPQAPSRTADSSYDETIAVIARNLAVE